MDSQQQQLGSFEDQVRRMMTGTSSMETDRSAPDAHARPTVRLPQAHHYNRMNDPQQQHPQYYQQHPHAQQNLPFPPSQRAFPSHHQQHHGNGQPSRQQYHPPSTALSSHYSTPARKSGPASGFAHNYSQPTLRPTQVDPNAYERRGPRPGFFQGQRQPRQLYNPDAMPRGPPPPSNPHWQHAQAAYLEQLAGSEVRSIEMTQAERNEKDAFRGTLQAMCQEVCASKPGQLPAVSLECFGSFSSGFASAGSDMDLVIVVKDGSPSSACFSLLEDDLPRALEKAMLQRGIGARLLTRTRVPIIKVCEKPETSLLDRLREEREKWDVLPNEKKYPHLHKEEADPDEGGHTLTEEVMTKAEQDGHRNSTSENKGCLPNNEDLTSAISGLTVLDDTQQTVESREAAAEVVKLDREVRRRNQQEKDKTWTRERKAGPLDFPKDGVGIQCDINFFNPLGIHNTQMLRCYSLCDPRVRHMVLFVKAWAKRRKINSSYSGTLSSYGYVLMVLHYLVNVIRPAVLPNLQHGGHPAFGGWLPGQNSSNVDEWTVDFFSDEAAIVKAAADGQITSNTESIGSLLAGFFHYYASQGGGQSFYWMGNVLSLRTNGGLLSKEEKGWVKAITEEGEGKKVQHRYLFCIEDPFELHHNVARTVTHHGIVAIRDEFRRAHRILIDAGNGRPLRDGELLAAVLEQEPGKQSAQMVAAPNMPESMVVPQLGHHQQHQETAHFQHSRGGLSGRAPAKPSPQYSKAPNVTDNEAFPVLGMGKQGKKKSRGTKHPDEVSGGRAKAMLDGARSRKTKQQAH